MTAILVKKNNVLDVYKENKLYASNKPSNKILILDISKEEIDNLIDGIYDISICENISNKVIDIPSIGEDEYEIYCPDVRDGFIKIIINK